MGMVTYGGERVSLNGGAPSLHTIGVALGRIPRFCGHTREFYPVLGHCVTVARLLPPELAVDGILHDSQESLFADVPTPMKTQVARRRERRVLKRIYESLGLEMPDDEMQELIDEADHTALIAEAHVLGHPGGSHQWGFTYDKQAAGWTKAMMRYSQRMLDADYAGDLYVRRFNEFLANVNPARLTRIAA